MENETYINVRTASGIVRIPRSAGGSVKKPLEKKKTAKGSGIAVFGIGLCAISALFSAIVYCLAQLQYASVLGETFEKTAKSIASVLEAIGIRRTFVLTNLEYWTILLVGAVLALFAAVIGVSRFVFYARNAKKGLRAGAALLFGILSLLFAIGALLCVGETVLLLLIATGVL
ncbi:MAG: hypothetical protein MJ082_05445 [Clostridia bacterium]|nr:hypothetical protein [Clostridia bacterium]